ncbi:hypothetical protein T10_10097 [Trichinella papuae]|uniref:Uncharacterized protein n=1 Tax=Trichinella papuae TaxID=268474 RepID=A0A0V1MNI4_9BILA|nr:hypothetical protein T10_10097 [Trichinella papuae]
MAYYPTIRLSEGPSKLSTFPNQNSMALFIGISPRVTCYTRHAIAVATQNVAFYSLYLGQSWVQEFEVPPSSLIYMQVELFPYPMFFGKVNSTVTTLSGQAWNSAEPVAMLCRQVRTSNYGALVVPIFLASLFAC